MESGEGRIKRQSLFNPGLPTVVQTKVFVLSYGTEDHLCELRGPIVGGTQYKAEDLELPILFPPEAVSGEVTTHRPQDKLTGRALGVTPKANGPPEAWANGGVLRRIILGCTCLCMCLCVARGYQGTLLTVTGQAEHLILPTGRIHFVLISGHRLTITYQCTWAHFCPVRGFQSKPAKGEQDVFPQGMCTQHLAVGPMDLKLWQHCLCQGNGFGTSLQPLLAENREKH